MRRLLLVAIAIGLVTAVASSPSPASASTYRLRWGDTLSGLSSRLGIGVSRLADANSITDPDRIYAGQELRIPDSAGPVPRARPAATPDAEPSSAGRIEARAILVGAAHDQGLRPSFVLAVSYWESGWNQSRVSSAGAVGLMQVTPETAAWAGPQLLGRHVNLGDAHDNAELGSALLRRYLDEFGDPKLALAAYYQGPNSIRRYGIYPSSRTYVDGIWALRNRFEAANR